MSRVRPSWTPPSSSSAGAYVFGFDFTTDIVATASGVWWYQPATGSVSNVEGRLYDRDSQTLLASGTLSSGSITQGAWNYVPFSSPYSISTSVNYSACAAASGEHAYDDPAGYPITAPVGHVTSTQGRYLAGTGFPTSTWSGQHGVDLEFSTVATVSLTPATVNLTSPAVTPIPDPVVVSLTPAVAVLTAQPVTPTPGAVTVSLTPAALTLAAVPLVLATDGATGFRHESTRTNFRRIGGA